MVEQENGKISCEKPQKRMYGIQKIEEMIKNTNKSSQIYQFGVDLQECGLNINGKQMISNYVSPLYQSENSNGLQYEIPESYLKPIMSKKIQIEKMSEKTLFFIFYNLNDQEMQINAAEQLESFGWSYIQKYQIWVKDLQRSQDNFFMGTYFNFDKFTNDLFNNIEILPSDIQSINSLKSLLMMN